MENRKQKAGYTPGTAELAGEFAALWLKSRALKWRMKELSERLPSGSHPTALGTVYVRWGLRRAINLSRLKLAIAPMLYNALFDEILSRTVKFTPKKGASDD